MDGHTASLFPETMALTVLAPENRGRWVLPVHLRSRDSWRITLAPPLINAASHIAFIATGGDKAAVVHDVLQGARRPETLPAQLIEPAGGELTWYLDQAAATQLNN
jgi:6-phosphogluconolactonase